jgi:hypothetical protein
MFVSNFQIRKDSNVPYLDVQITKDGSVPLRYVDQGQSCPNATLIDLSNIVDLTDVDSIEFKLKKCGRTPVDASTTGTVEILDAKTGMVRYKWAITDTAVVGLFYGTFVITFTDHSVYRWPKNLESLSIQIVD